MEKRRRMKHLRQQRNEETRKKYSTFNEAKKWRNTWELDTQGSTGMNVQKDWETEEN